MSKSGPTAREVVAARTLTVAEAITACGGELMGMSVGFTKETSAGPLTEAEKTAEGRRDQGVTEFIALPGDLGGPPSPRRRPPRGAGCREKNLISNVNAIMIDPSNSDGIAATLDVPTGQHE